MKGEASFSAVMTAAGGFAIDRDDVRNVGTKPLYPGQETGFEQIRIDGSNNVAQRVMARNALLIRQEAAEEVLTFCAPQPDLDEIIAR